MLPPSFWIWVSAWADPPAGWRITLGVVCAALTLVLSAAGQRPASRAWWACIISSHLAARTSKPPEYPLLPTTYYGARARGYTSATRVASWGDGAGLLSLREGSQWRTRSLGPSHRQHWKARFSSALSCSGNRTWSLYPTGRSCWRHNT